jgi:hypothetical protein
MQNKLGRVRNAHPTFTGERFIPDSAMLHPGYMKSWQLVYLFRRNSPLLQQWERFTALLQREL